MVKNFFRALEGVPKYTKKAKRVGGYHNAMYIGGGYPMYIGEGVPYVHGDKIPPALLGAPKNYLGVTKIALKGRFLG